MLIISDKADIVTFRPVNSDDEHFLLSLFYFSRPDLKRIEGISCEMKEMLIRQQFLIEEKYLKENYPNADYNIILLDGKAIGRLYVYKGEVFWRLLLIALLPEYRNKGIGGRLIKSILDEALEVGKQVRLQVAWYNKAAHKLYERNGFYLLKDTGPVSEMQWNP